MSYFFRQVGRAIEADDVRALDPEYFKNRMELLLGPGGVETMQSIYGLDSLHFVEIDPLEVGGYAQCKNHPVSCYCYRCMQGTETAEELKPGGRNVVVTEENKYECVFSLHPRRSPTQVSMRSDHCA